MRNGQTPRAIQDILYKQIRGFEISESALRLAALALYITAIELNASPRPPRDLKFPAKPPRGGALSLRGPGRRREKSADFPLGSLGPEVPRELDEKFDIVIGNPPWTRLRDRTEEGEDEADKKESQVRHRCPQLAVHGDRAAECLRPAASFEFAENYHNPDIQSRPPLSLASDGVGQGGRSHCARHACPVSSDARRATGFEAWRAILRSVEVTGLDQRG